MKILAKIALALTLTVAAAPEHSRARNWDAMRCGNIMSSASRKVMKLPLAWRIPIFLEA